MLPWHHANPFVVDDEPHLIAGLQTQPFSHLRRDGDLTLAGGALQGRRCVIETAGALGSVQIRFLDNDQREIVSRRALRVLREAALAR
jgi:hypothetical protein